MNLDPRTPILVGTGQVEQRVDDPAEAVEPLEMMMSAIETAAQDAGSRDLLARADAVYVIRGVWRYGNPGRVVAERIGAPDATTFGTPWGGNMVQSAVNHAAVAILRGDRDVVLLTGAEQGRTQARARKQGIKLAHTDAPGAPDQMLEPEKPMVHEAEVARDIGQPIQLYPVFENAIRYARGESIEAHRARISELWARFNQVAVKNPHAWIRTPLSAEEIRTPSPSNRMVGFPYTKLMNSNNAVDQGAALILCSVEAAERAGIARDRWIFPHAGTDAHDHYMVSNRADLHSSPAIRIAGTRALELAETSVDELRYVDLYSCFPSAVQVAATELGFSQERDLTVTGGLTFGGGPLNNYVMHSIARMVEVLRDDPGSRGLVSANGGFLTKHAFCVYSTEPPAAGFRHDAPQKEVDALPSREAVVDHAGEVEIESYTAMYGAEGPELGIAACLLPDGRRTWAKTTEPAVVEAMTREEFCGRPARIDGKGSLEV